ncbi:hypothetical protein ACS0TY_012765 [Phlomoides rotata]
MDVVGEPVPGFMRSSFNVYKKKTIEEYLNYAVELAINHINSKCRLGRFTNMWTP